MFIPTGVCGGVSQVILHNSVRINLMFRLFLSLTQKLETSRIHRPLEFYSICASAFLILSPISFYFPDPIHLLSGTLFWSLPLQPALSSRILSPETLSNGGEFYIFVAVSRQFSSALPNLSAFKNHVFRLDHPPPLILAVTCRLQFSLQDLSVSSNC